ncbi:thioredoxin domain-containing protein [Nanohaloarchaea archaeon]|nr:thioredoxin domain-containing protein [Candidatus Nanohaloarchaea archaeon]
MTQDEPDKQEKEEEEDASKKEAVKQQKDQDQSESENSQKESATDHKDSGTQQEEDSSQSGTVQLSVKSLVAGVFVLGVAVGFAGGVLTGNGGLMIAQPGNDAPNPSQAEETGSQETDTVDMSKIDMEGEPVLGQEDAPVTMVIYEDYQCPFCKRFETQTFPKIKSNYVDSGDVKVVWKDFPAPSLGHDWSEPAAAATECVYREGGNEAFWNVNKKVFEKAKTLTRGEDEFTTENIQSRIKEFASEEGVSESAVQSCIENDNPMQEVNEDKQGILGITSNIGTPTAVVNGKKVVGAQPYPQFETVIEEELS